MKALISIIIPVKNGAQTIGDCLNAIANQTIFDRTEIIVIDSGSVDDTLEILNNFNVILIKIDPKTFNHGATRNLGVQHAQGEFVLMTVQDAIAADTKWLETMVDYFKDPEVVGVCGQQAVPHHQDKNPHEWFRPHSIPKARFIQFLSKKDFDALSPEDKRSVCSWDNVNTIYRKNVLIEIPFETIAFGEDMLWAKNTLQRGHKLVYEPAAKVWHYHFQYPEFVYRRALISKLFTYKFFGYAQPQHFNFKDYALVVFRNFKWGCSPKWIFHNFAIIYQHRKATKDLNNAIKNNTLLALESDLSLNVPIGKQNMISK